MVRFFILCPFRVVNYLLVFCIIEFRITRCDVLGTICSSTISTISSENHRQSSSAVLLSQAKPGLSIAKNTMTWVPGSDICNFVNYLGVKLQ